MAFYAVPYEIHFDDTMAYGSHHFLTNFKFQCAGREHLLFSDRMYRDPAFRQDFERVILYTAEAYSRNLGPAALGDRLAVLVSVEERTAVGLRFCFRTLREDGEPIAVGYQSMLCAAREGGVVAWPASFERCFDGLAGLMEAPDEQGRTFRERVHLGGKAVRALFPADVRALAATVHAPGIVERAPALALPAGARVVLLGGQGTFDPDRLPAGIHADPGLRVELAPVLVRVHERLGVPHAAVQALLTSGDAARAAVAAHPDLDQVGIWLAGVLAARAVPDAALVMGHSFGEIAALTAAGALSLVDGAEVVCQRVLALRGCEALGTLAAVGLGERDAEALLAELALAGVVVAGVNHPAQTVLAGPAPALEQVAAALAARGKPCTLVPSRYPFHHAALEPARERFHRAIAAVPTSPPSIPVWSPIDGRLYTGAPGEIARALSGQLVRPFRFLDAVQGAAEAGATRFYDTTGGRIGRIVARILGDRATVELPADPARPVAASAAASGPEPSPQPSPGGRGGGGEPIAIVSLGCLFPGGARDPEAYWRLIRDGGSGVHEDPSLVADFVAHPLRADKASTTLAGRVDDADLPTDPGLDRIQRLLVAAARQCHDGLSARSRAVPADRVRVWLGSTADGSAELDATLALEALGLDEPRLASALSARPGRSAALTPHAALSAVVRGVFGEVETVLVDAACASSLYTTALGVAALRSGQADLVLSGGAFSPGPGNNCLFSQFKGLSTRGIRPFDAAADGVIFGEGAGLVALKRLSDALADGDRVHAVIAGVGLSSDGRSSSANVPRAEGQRKALDRAWAGLDPHAVGYVEAHGTGTAAGDRTELEALQGFFAGLDRRVPIGSVKAQTGHLGWVAGIASIVKLCKMFEHEQIPRQHQFDTPGPALLAADRFECLVAARPWPRTARPRIAAASGFGFGGTDAHVVLQDFAPAPAATARVPVDELVVVGTFGLWPAGDRVTDADRALPASIRLLPDIADDMDATQALVTKGGAELLAGLGATAALRERTALVVALEGKTDRGVEAVVRVLGDRVRRLLREAGAPDVHAARRIDTLRPSTAYTLQGMMPNVTPGRAAGLLDLQGPNFVVDAGPGSLSAALVAARDLLALGAELVLAGGVHCGARVALGDGRPAPRDGLVLLAVTTAAAAEAHGLRPIARLTPEGAAPIDLTRHARRGAEGGPELLHAVDEARAGRTAAVRLPGARWTVRPAAAPVGFSTGSPVRYAAPRLVARPATSSATLAGRRVLLVGAPALADALAAAGADVHVWGQGQGWPPLPRSGGEGRGEGERGESDPPDVLLLGAVLPDEDAHAALERATLDRALVDASFLAMQALYGRIVAGTTQVLALHVGGLRVSGGLHPATGLLAGMCKSVAREAPEGTVRVVSTSAMPLDQALRLAARELDLPERAIERAYDGERRLVRVLQELPVGEGGGTPLDAASVVILTGGARGVTAVLAEALLRRTGCTAVLVGRTREGAAPPELLALNDAAFDAVEPQFYAEQVARAQAEGRLVTLPELRRTFEGYRSARDLAQTLARLRAVGRVVYRAVDVTDAAQVDALVGEVVHEHGRVDLVVHGAGLQTSKKLDRRKPDELKRNLDAKLLGLHRLYAALRARGLATPVHTLTSAFSYFGNDGQADYGAANEVLDRLCERFPGWASVGWLAWDRIGMTRSPEYAVLGAARKLHGITAEEGARLFLDVLEGRVRAPVQHQITDGEVAWYDLEVLPAGDDAGVERVRPVSFDEGSVPVLNVHRVRGTPTVPGAWALDRMVAAASLDAPVVEVEDLAFTRFVRVPPGTTSELRVSLQDEGGRTVARLAGDIVHKSGVVLQGDVDFSRAALRASPSLPAPALPACDDGQPAADPYCAEGSPIALAGPFDCLRDIRIGAAGRSARFEGADGLSERVPALLLDAAWRLSAMHAEDGAIHAPVSFARVSFATDPRAVRGSLSLRATPPRVDGDLVRCDRVEAVDSAGRLVLAVEGGLARRIS